MEDSLIRIFGILQELRDLMAKHLIDGLYHLGLQPFKITDVVTPQDLLELMDVGNITCR